MIVVDTNVLVYLMIPSEHTATAERVREKGNGWTAPLLMPHEYLNVLADHVRRQILEQDEAARLFRRGRPIGRVPDRWPEAAEVLRMSASSGCSTYDVEYVWLAREMNVPLVTADGEVLTAFPDIAVSMEDFARV